MVFMVSSTRDLSDYANAKANATNTICHVPLFSAVRIALSPTPLYPLLNPNSLSSSPLFFSLSLFPLFYTKFAISPFSISACSLRIIRQHLFTFSFLLFLICRMDWDPTLCQQRR